MRYRPIHRLAAGHHVLGARFTADSAARHAGGWVDLTVDGQRVARGRVETTLSMHWWTEGIDIGRDLITAVSEDYTVPADFTGTIRSVTISQN